MTTYAIKCIKNPCGSTSGQWYAGSWTAFGNEKPKSGMPINDAYQKLNHLYYDHHASGCGCAAEVVELED